MKPLTTLRLAALHLSLLACLASAEGVRSLPSSENFYNLPQSVLNEVTAEARNLSGAETTESIVVIDKAIQLGSSLVIVPLILPRKTGKYDTIFTCAIAEIRVPEGSTLGSVQGIRWRDNLGFADDYEPCIAVDGVSMIDVNRDGNGDVVLLVRYRDAHLQEYRLLDVYLSRAGEQVCFSSEATRALSNLDVSGKWEETLRRHLKRSPAMARLRC